MHPRELSLRNAAGSVSHAAQAEINAVGQDGAQKGCFVIGRPAAALTAANSGVLRGMANNGLIRRLRFQMIAGIASGLLLEPVSAARASVFGPLGGNNFSSISKNMTSSVDDIPGLLTALAYLLGLLLGVSAIIKIKDHVENPSNTPFKDGVVRLGAGGALFALPIIYEAMFVTNGAGSAASAATLYKANFNVQ